MIPKATEDTITTILSQKLTKLNVNSVPFTSLPTPSGYRKPDIFCTNGNHYVVEAKFRESDLFKAVGKIYDDYLKHHKYLGIKGGFAVLYPKELSKPLSSEEIEKLAEQVKFKIVAIFSPDDSRPFTVYEGNLSDIAKKISEHVLAPPSVVEPSIKFMIQTLREATDYIVSGFKDLAERELEEVFGGKDVFTNILEYEEGKYPTEEMKVAVAYLLINQILFYHVLSRKKSSEKFPEIDADRLRSPEDLQEYFRRVTEINYEVLYSYEVAKRIPPKYLDRVRTIINAIKGLTPEKVKSDLLGTIFHDVIPFEIRKKVAAFYTNVLAAELLAHLSINSYDAKVADFAAGSGGLLVGSYKRKRELFERNNNFSQVEHIKFIEKDLIGIDVMPFAAHLAATHLALQNPEYISEKVQIAVWDSTELAPLRVIPTLEEISYVLKGQSTLEMYSDESKPVKKGVAVLKKGKAGEEIKLDTLDIVIMNPPFTRQERIPEIYKKTLLDRFSEYQSHIDGRMGYYNYFILLADRFLKTNGRMALVLPATFIRALTSKNVRKLLLDNYSIEWIISNKELNFSESTWRREILLVARKSENKNGKDKTAFVTLNRLPQNEGEVLKFFTKLQSHKNDDEFEDPELQLISIGKEELSQNLDNWFRYIAIDNPKMTVEWSKILEENESLIKFKELCENKKIEVKRGIETTRGMKFQSAIVLSDPSHAVRKEDTWIVIDEGENIISVQNRHLPNLSLDIPKQSVSLAIRTLSNVNAMDVKGNTDYVLVNKFPGVKDFFANGELIKALTKWRPYVEDRKGKLIIGRRIVLPEKGTVHLAYFSSEPISSPGVTWICSDINDEDAKILCLWFNSSIHLLQLLICRVEDVWADVHKYVLNEMFVLDPSKLSKSQKEVLLNLAEEILHCEFPSLLEQFTSIPAMRKELDKEILRILGFKEKEIDSTLDRIYSVLSYELKNLRNIEKAISKS